MPRTKNKSKKSSPNSIKSSEKEGASEFSQLLEILLEQERKDNSEQNSLLKKEVSRIDNRLENPDQFIKLVENSKDEVIDLLSPYFGKLLKKFIQVEIEKVFAGIENSRKRFFTIKGLKNTLFKKAGVKITESQINEQDPLNRLFVIQKPSGLLLGNYVLKEDNIDLDIVSGMLTAIKDFSESAFDQKNQDLDSISYSGYNLLLHSYRQFFLVAVIDGFISPDFKSRMYDDFLILGELLNMDINEDTEVTDELVNHISTTIKTHFTGNEQH